MAGLFLTGCKIKALRGKTNTYIKTPIRGEEPVFVVTGRKEDVEAAKREIASAADHFSQIRASRKQQQQQQQQHQQQQNHHRSSNTCSPTPTGRAVPPERMSPCPVRKNDGNSPSQISIGVRVPVCVVGLVVGPKGATIKRIQQETQTYIITPAREKDPVFEVIGTPENVQRARLEIESYIETRVGVSGSDMDQQLPDPVYGTAQMENQLRSQLLETLLRTSSLNGSDGGGDTDYISSAMTSLPPENHQFYSSTVSYPDRLSSPKRGLCDKLASRLQRDTQALDIGNIECVDQLILTTSAAMGYTWSDFLISTLAHTNLDLAKKLDFHHHHHLGTEVRDLNHNGYLQTDTGNEEYLSRGLLDDIAGWSMKSDSGAGKEAAKQAGPGFSPNLKSGSGGSTSRSPSSSPTGSFGSMGY